MSFKGATPPLYLYASPVAIPYAFSADLSGGNPGTGRCSLNNASENVATAINLNLTDANGLDWSNIITVWSGTAGTARALLRLASVSNPLRWLFWQVTSQTLNLGYTTLGLQPLASASQPVSPFADGALVLLLGDRGA
jgi:hypothetical protein